MESTNWLGALGLVVSLLAIWVSYRGARRSELGVAAWTQEVRTWSRDVISTLTAARYVLIDNSDTTPSAASHTQNLSVLIDVGRFYFPNHEVKDHGVNNSSAYRGYRHPVLDPLVAGVRLLESEPADRVADASVLWELQREFVSCVSDIIEPRFHNRAIAQMLRRGHAARKRDPSVGGFLPGHRRPPLGAAAALKSATEKVRRIGR